MLAAVMFSFYMHLQGSVTFAIKRTHSTLKSVTSSIRCELRRLNFVNIDQVSSETTFGFETGLTAQRTRKRWIHSTEILKVLPQIFLGRVRAITLMALERKQWTDLWLYGNCQI